MVRYLIFVLALLVVVPAYAAHSKPGPAKHASPLIQDKKVVAEAATSGQGSEGQVDLGQMLYKNHCTSCHEDNAHLRESSKVNSPADLRKWVLHWSSDMELKWQGEQLDAVVDYLNRQFYKFPVDKP